MISTTRRAAVFAIAMTMPGALQAQRGQGGGPGSNPVAPLIDMRRELNLSARQLVQLDSIERGLIQRNQALRERLRSRLDSVRPRARQSSEEEIQRFRAEADSMRAVRQVIVRNDSVARASAMSILTDSQRVRVRERMAERRGFDAGRMSTMRGQRGLRGRQGGDGPGRGGFGPRLRQGPGGRGMGIRPPRGGMRGPDQMGPRRFDDRRPGPPDDSMRPMRRFRPPVDDSAPGDQGLVPRRRPPADSGR
jgi:hypothetical protein